VFVVGPARPRTQHGYHHDTKVKPKAATAVIELLMMGGRTPETCWAVNTSQDNKLENCCIWLVIYLNWSLIRRRPRAKTTYSPLSDGYQRFRGTLCLCIQGISWKAHIDNHLHGDLVSWPRRPQFKSSTWRMEAICSFESMVPTYQNKRRHNPVYNEMRYFSRLFPYSFHLLYFRK